MSTSIPKLNSIAAEIGLTVEYHVHRADTLPRGYLAIAGGWSYAPLRVGLVVRAPDGQEVYCQPGDDAEAMRANIEALYEIEGGEKRATICAMILGDYFS